MKSRKGLIGKIYEKAVLVRTLETLKELTEPTENPFLFFSPNAIRDAMRREWIHSFYGSIGEQDMNNLSRNFHYLDLVIVAEIVGSIGDLDGEFKKSILGYRTNLNDENIERWDVISREADQDFGYFMVKYGEELVSEYVQEIK